MVQLESDDNSALFETLREGTHLINNRHVPTLRKWLAALASAESDVRTPHHATPRYAHAVDVTITTLVVAR